MSTIPTLHASTENLVAPCYPLTGHPTDSPISILPPNAEALRTIAENLCEPDKAELAALGHHDLHSVIATSLKASREAYVAYWDGAPQAVFGVADYPQDDRFGIPWLLSTGTGARHVRDFMAASHRMIEAWSPMYLGMFNLVSEHHHTAHDWLKALGFDPLKTHMINGHAFIEYGRFNHV